MAKWRVYNKHSMGYTHKEKFREELVEIPANQYVLMDYEDAVQFRGQYFPMLKTPDGQPDPKGWKMIHIEPDPDHMDAPTATEKGKIFVCHLDGKEFPTKEALAAYTSANYSHLNFTDESAEKETKKSKRA